MYTFNPETFKKKFSKKVLRKKKVKSIDTSSQINNSPDLNRMNQKKKFKIHLLKQNRP